jgi:DNA invertase Pin-like site-specific DNA recombinase
MIPVKREFNASAAQATNPLYKRRVAGYARVSTDKEEQSRNISENTTWGQRRRFADGKVTMAYGQFLGYAKGEDGKPIIVEEEAAIVRLIYRLFIEGTLLGDCRLSYEPRNSLAGRQGKVADGDGSVNPHQ